MRSCAGGRLEVRKGVASLGAGSGAVPGGAPAASFRRQGHARPASAGGRHDLDVRLRGRGRRTDFSRLRCHTGLRSRVARHRCAAVAVDRTGLVARQLARSQATRHQSIEYATRLAQWRGQATDGRHRDVAHCIGDRTKFDAASGAGGVASCGRAQDRVPDARHAAGCALLGPMRGAIPARRMRLHGGRCGSEHREVGGEDQRIAGERHEQRGRCRAAAIRVIEQLPGVRVVEQDVIRIECRRRRAGGGGA